MAQKSRLTLEQREEVRRMYLEGVKIREIAEHFGVYMGNITYICKDIQNRNGDAHIRKQIDAAFRNSLIEWEYLRMKLNPKAVPYTHMDMLEKGWYECSMESKDTPIKAE